MIQDWLQRLARFLDRPFFPWKKLVIGFSLGEFALENWLLYRQYRVLCGTKVPKALEQEVDQTTFDKSQEYGRAKAKFGFLSGLLSQAKSIAVLYFDVMPKFWYIAGFLVSRYFPARFSGEITQSLVWFFLFNMVDTLFNIPTSYYHHFVLEEKFGFNKMTKKTWITDMLKGQALGVVFGVPIGTAFLSIVKRTGDNFFYYLWVFMLFLQTFMITIYPIVIVPIFNKLTPLEPGPLKDAVEALAAKLNFPLAELQVIDGSRRSAHSNAYFTGMPWKKKIVIYDTLLEKSTHQEVEAVLGHELGHWSKGHTTKLLLISQVHLFYIFALFSVFVHNNSLYEAFGFHGIRPTMIGFVLFNEILSPTDAVLKLVMNFLTRTMEFEADKFAVDLGYANELGAALLKLQIQNLSSMDADPLYSSFHYSHPILTERLKAMNWTGSAKAKEQKVLDEEKPVKATEREL